MKRRHFNALLCAAAGAGSIAPVFAQTAATAANVLVVGDSLSAEYGLRRGSGWVQILQERMIKDMMG